MATSTISTNKWIETASPVVSLRTDKWLADLGQAEVVTLRTDEWGLFLTPGGLPNYNPSLVTSVTKVYQNLSFPQFVFAGQGTTNDYKLFKKTTTQTFTLWRSPVYNIGTDFDVMGITFNLAQDIAAGMSIIPKLYFDNQRSSSVGTTINASNYSDRLIYLTPKNFSNSVHGKINFFLEFQFTGSVLSVISLPINIEIEKNEN